MARMALSILGCAATRNFSASSREKLRTVRIPAMTSSAASLARARASCALRAIFDILRPTTTAPTATGGTRASMSSVSLGDDATSSVSPPTSMTRLRNPMERLTLTVF